MWIERAGNVCQLTCWFKAPDGLANWETYDLFQVPFIISTTSQGLLLDERSGIPYILESFYGTNKIKLQVRGGTLPEQGTILRGSIMFYTS